jgi:ABC-type branched-subunit amino acid transport system substrate-binding protein
MQWFLGKIGLAVIVLLGTVAILGYLYLPAKGLPAVKEGQVVRWQIGVIESLTGPAAYLGEQNKKGVETAKLVLERNNPNLKLDIWHEDSMYSGQGGISAYQKLRSAHKLDAVMTHASPVPYLCNRSLLPMGCYRLPLLLLPTVTVQKGICQ